MTKYDFRTSRIQFDPEDRLGNERLMNRADEFPNEYHGENSKGEDIAIKVKPTCIAIITWHKDGQKNTDIFWKNGKKEHIREELCS